MNAIEVSHLHRIFRCNIGVIKRTAREIIAVDDVPFEIQEGAVRITRTEQCWQDNYHQAVDYAAASNVRVCFG